MCTAPRHLLPLASALLLAGFAAGGTPPQAIDLDGTEWNLRLSSRLVIPGELAPRSRETFGVLHFGAAEFAISESAADVLTDLDGTYAQPGAKGTRLLLEPGALATDTLAGMLDRWFAEFAQDEGFTTWSFAVEKVGFAPARVSARAGLPGLLKLRVSGSFAGDHEGQAVEAPFKLRMQLRPAANGDLGSVAWGKERPQGAGVRAALAANAAGDVLLVAARRAAGPQGHALWARLGRIDAGELQWQGWSPLPLADGVQWPGEAPRVHAGLADDGTCAVFYRTAADGAGVWCQAGTAADGTLAWEPAVLHPLPLVAWDSFGQDSLALAMDRDGYLFAVADQASPPTGADSAERSLLGVPGRLQQGVFTWSDEAQVLAALPPELDDVQPAVTLGAGRRWAVALRWRVGDDVQPGSVLLGQLSAAALANTPAALSGCPAWPATPAIALTGAQDLVLLRAPADGALLRSQVVPDVFGTDPQAGHEQPVARGVLPALAGTPSGWLVEAHRTGKGRLRGSPGMACTARDWMGSLPGYLDLKVCQLSVPGTHDCGAYWLDTSRRAPFSGLPAWAVTALDLSHYVGDTIDSIFDFDWDLPWYLDWIEDLIHAALGGFISDVVNWVDGQVNQITYQWAKAQDLTVREQLEAGVRFLDLRFCQVDGELYTHHGLLGQPAGVLVADIRDYLGSVSDGHELLFVGVSHLDEFADAHHEQLLALLQAELGDYLHPCTPGTWDLAAARVGDIVGQGSRVVVFYMDEWADAHPSELAAAGLWPDKSGWIYANYANSSHLPTMLADQSAKLLQHPGGPQRLFELQFQLTAQESDVQDDAVNQVKSEFGDAYNDLTLCDWCGSIWPIGTVCNPIPCLPWDNYAPRTLHDLATQANGALAAFVESHRKLACINVLLMDFVEESPALELSRSLCTGGLSER